MFNDSHDMQLRSWLNSVGESEALFGESEIPFAKTNPRGLAVTIVTS